MVESEHRPAPGGGLQPAPPIPFLTTSFSYDLALFLCLWPVWWLLGVEQLLVPFFALWEALRSLIRRRGRLRFNSTVGWALALACWWVVPIGWLDGNQLRLFIKESATVWAQVLFLCLFVTEVRDATDWRRVMFGLAALSTWVSIGAAVFLCGLWQGEITSLVGGMLPAELVAGSEFFSSIAFRSLGELELLRVNSLALAFSSLSLFCLLVIPFQAWRARRAEGALKLWHALMLAGLVAALLGAQSRLAYLALVLGAGVAVMLAAWRHSDWRLRWLLGASVVLALAASSWWLYGDLAGEVKIWLSETRPESLAVRMIVWEETLLLLGEHPIAGWGAPVQIPGMRTLFSAGTHSSVLAILFQHGVVGLALYLGLWLSVWRRILRALARRRPRPSWLVGFWPMAAVAMVSFNLRELADNWWWDQLVTLALWSLWGLILTADRVRALTAGVARPEGDHP